MEHLFLDVIEYWGKKKVVVRCPGEQSSEIMQASLLPAILINKLMRKRKMAAIQSINCQEQWAKENGASVRWIDTIFVVVARMPIFSADKLIDFIGSGVFFIHSISSAFNFYLHECDCSIFAPFFHIHRLILQAKLMLEQEKNKIKQK